MQPLPKCFALTLALIAALPAQAGALEEIQQSGVLRVCIWPDYLGISHRNLRTGALQGLDIDLSQALADDLRVRPVYVDTSFSALIDDLIDRKCHIGMTGIGITPERRARLNFSQPYLRSDVYAIAMRSNTALRGWDDLDQPGRSIAVQKNTYMEAQMRKSFKNARLVVTEHHGEREREVFSGRADAFITDYPYSQRMLMGTDWARRLAPTQPLLLTEYAYAVVKGDERWLARVNQFVARIKSDGRLEDAGKRHALTPAVTLD